MASSPASVAATVEPAGPSTTDSPNQRSPRSGIRRAEPAAPSRRVGAGMVDLIWIGIPTILVARLTGESTLTSGPRPSISTSQLEAVQQARPWRVTLALADHGLSLSPAGLTMTVLTIALAAVLATVIVPLLDEGRTPGMALFRLRIVGIDGRQPTAWALAIRTLASVVDLMPVVVPGLVGFAFAASNPRRQRIGDRLADTAVIYEPRISPAAEMSTGPTHRFAIPGDGTWPLPPRLNRPRIRGDFRFDTVAQLSPGLAGLAVASSGWTPGGPPSMTNHSVDTNGRPPAGRLLDRPPVAKRPLFNPYPKPQRPARRKEQTQTGSEQARYRNAPASATTESEAEDSTIPMSSYAPEWNEEWQSWVYWDGDRRQWLRFDTETGEWEPMV